MHESFKWRLVRTMLLGVGIGLSSGGTGAILVAGMAPEMLPERAKRIIISEPPPPTINYGYDPLECDKNAKFFQDNGIVLQQGQVIFVGATAIDVDSRKLIASDIQGNTVVSDKAVTIRAGENSTSRTYTVTIGDRIILDENKPFEGPLAYRAAITGFCGNDFPYGPYLHEIS